MLMVLMISYAVKDLSGLLAIFIIKKKTLYGANGLPGSYICGLPDIHPDIQPAAQAITEPKNMYDVVDITRLIRSSCDVGDSPSH